MIKVLDCGFKVSKFKLQSCHYIYFGTNTVGKGNEPPYSPPHAAMGQIVSVVLQECLWH